MQRPERPNVSVIMPFAGAASEAASATSQLGELAIADGDERILVDNSHGGVAEPAEGVRVIRAAAIGSSYYARNEGARVASGEWLLFVDSDCLLPTNLVNEYFAESPGERTGLVAGAIAGDPAQDALVARYHRSRGHLDAEHPLGLGPSPAAGTANLLVRHAVWAELEGFREVVSGADFEFSWRAGAAGWGVEHRPAARVLHRHPEDVGSMRLKARRYGAGQRWLNGLYPGTPRPPGLRRELVRGAAGVAVWGLTARFERAAFKALDVAWISAYSTGWRRDSNLPNLLNST